MSSGNQEPSRHQRYRRGRAIHHHNTRRSIRVLKGKNLRSATYLALIAQGELLKKKRVPLLRRAVLSYYADMFDVGIDPSNRTLFKKQRCFLDYHLSKNCVVESSSDTTTSAVEHLMKAWETYTCIYDDLYAKFISIQCIDPDQDVFVLTQNLTMTITKRAIERFSPQLREFTSTAVGKCLNIKLQHRVQYNADNQIVYINIEYQAAQGWCQVVGGPSFERFLSSQQSFKL